MRIIIWLIPLTVFFSMAYDFFSFDGYFHLKYEAGKQTGYVSRFYSPDNYEFVENEQAYLKIFKTPTAFNIKVPVKFDSGKIKLTFRTEDLESFQFGVIEDEGKKNFRLYEIINENKGGWNTQVFEINLEGVYYHPTDRLGFVFLFENGELDVKGLEFDLYRKNLWQTLFKK